MLQLLIDKFNGFEASDFDAYRPEKWKSNRYNGERLRVRQKMEALGRTLQPAIGEQVGLPLEVEASSDRPSLWNQMSVHCQWICFLRPVAVQKVLERSPDFSGPLAQVITDPAAFNRHAFLGLKLDLHGVKVALKVNTLASADVATMAEGMAPTSTNHQTIRDLFAGLGDQYTVKLVGTRPGESSEWPANSAPLEQIAQTAEAKDFNSFSISKILPRARLEGSLEEVMETLKGELANLAPLYKLLTWHEANDLINLQEAMARQDEERAKRREAKELERQKREEERQLRTQEARRRTEEQEKERRETELLRRKLAEEQLRHRLQREQEEAERLAEAMAEAGEAPAPEVDASPTGEAGEAGELPESGKTVESTGTAEGAAGGAPGGEPAAVTPPVEKGVYWTKAGRQLYEEQRRREQQRAGERYSRPPSGSRDRQGRRSEGARPRPADRDSTRRRSPRSRGDSLFTSAPPSNIKPEDFTIGSQVMLNRGLFAGRLGTLKSLTGNKAEVQVGGLMVNMELRDLRKPPAQ